MREEREFRDSGAEIESPGSVKEGGDGDADKVPEGGVR